jgi:DNA-directed RNA polymerase specialized sigma24 family protein
MRARVNEMCANFEAAKLIRSCTEIWAAPARQSTTAEYELLRPLQASSKTAYSESIEQYQSKVNRLAYGILGHREHAGGIAQQVFLKAYFSVRSVDARSSLYNPIYRVVLEKCYVFLLNKPRSGPMADRIVQQRDLLNQLLKRISEEDRCLLMLTELEVTQQQSYLGCPD